ncbi:MAG: Gmad2 immunoglobulin-like domain-containing protein [Candidatus Paceibacterota bacterium]|jgi:hypothetical protein
MEKSTIIVVVIFIILIIIGGFLFDWFRPSTSEPQNKIVVDVNDMIQVTAPLSSSTVSSPLTITGKARGGWYFEASFPILLLDDSGAPIATAIAQAQGDWMTQDYVPFVATMTFDAPDSSTGTLILKKDNPSDDRRFDASVEIPIRFE